MKSGTQPTDRSVCRGSMQRDFLSGRRLPVPARLTVLIAEARARDQVASRLEEALAAELMMAPALDPVMIAPLERIEEGSTDHLCLSGVNGPVVLLAWMDVSQAAGHWRRLGLQGHLVPRGSTANPDERRVYYIEMHRDIQVPDILGQLEQGGRHPKCVGMRSRRPTGARGPASQRPVFCREVHRSMRGRSRLARNRTAVGNPGRSWSKPMGWRMARSGNTWIVWSTIWTRWIFDRQGLLGIGTSLECVGGASADRPAVGVAAKRERDSSGNGRGKVQLSMAGV